MENKTKSTDYQHPEIWTMVIAPFRMVCASGDSGNASGITDYEYEEW